MTSVRAGGSPRGEWVWSAAAIGGALIAGRVLATAVPAAMHSTMRDWILARALGLAGYAALTALVATGLWFRHPWRRGSRFVPSAALLRGHAALAAAAGVLIVAHVAILAIDSHAHVGWTGALIPGRSSFRPLPVALGTYAVYLGGLVAVTAALAGSIVGRWWLPVHKLAGLTFGLVWAHGVFAGSDLPALRGLYVGSGIGVGVLAVSRAFARRVEPAVREAR